MACSSRAAHQRVQPPLAQPGTEHDLASRGQGDLDILVVTVRDKRKVVKEGERLLQERRTCTCCHTGREKTGAKTSMALTNAIGKESIAILSGEKYMGYHCRSIMTQLAKMDKVELRQPSRYL
jgi:hypothetical protein